MGPLFSSPVPRILSRSSIRQPGGTAFYQALVGDTSTAEIQGRFHTNGFAQPASSPAGLGSARTTRTLSGYTGGIVEMRLEGGTGGDFAGDYVFTADPDDRGRTMIPGVSPSEQTGIRIFYGRRQQLDVRGSGHRKRRGVQQQLLLLRHPHRQPVLPGRRSSMTVGSSPVNYRLALKQPSATAS